MSKKTTSGSSMLLLAGLGVGAFMLFANKSNASGNAPSADLLPAGSGGDIPDAPKILAVNSTSTESPTPTGVVSDEEGMESTGSQTSYSQSGSSQTSSSFDDEPATSSAIAKVAAGVGAEAARKIKELIAIPSLVSTKLTAKEQGIINTGRLTAALALKRPDLYKAAYIKRYGGKTPAGKRSALIKASLAIDSAVSAAQAAANGGLTKATQYPAKPAFTFVQSAGGMAAQMAMSQMAALRKAGVKVSPAAKKVSAQVKAAKASTGTKPAASTKTKKVQPAKTRSVTKPAGKAARPPAKKRVIKKSR